MAHNFKNFPELTNSQMETMYFESPHKQITEDFRAKVIKVTDGDTIRVETDFRDFDFPIRFLNIDAPELNEPGGERTKDWLSEQILKEEIDVLIENNRVDKWGRLLGKIVHRGLDLGEIMLSLGLATKFENRNEDEIPNINQELNIKQWIK
jgi:endonuclease YncB( thermonuclease family)